MALVDVIRSGVKIVSNVTNSLKVPVTFTPWIGDDGAGTDEFGTPVTLMALVDPSQRQRFTVGGSLVMTFAVLTFVDPIDDTTPNAGKTRAQPVDPRDVFTLPGGGTAPVVDVAGFTDAGTQRGFYTEVTLGSVIRGD